MLRFRDVKHDTSHDRIFISYTLNISGPCHLPSLHLRQLGLLPPAENTRTRCLRFLTRRRQWTGRVPGYTTTPRAACSGVGGTPELTFCSSLHFSRVCLFVVIVGRGGQFEIGFCYAAQTRFKFVRILISALTAGIMSLVLGSQFLQELVFLLWKKLRNILENLCRVVYTYILCRYFI